MPRGVAALFYLLPDLVRGCDKPFSTVQHLLQRPVYTSVYTLMTMYILFIIIRLS
jgi:hypothetical protein